MPADIKLYTQTRRGPPSARPRPALEFRTSDARLRAREPAQGLWQMFPSRGRDEQSLLDSSGALIAQPTVYDSIEYQ